MTSYLTSPHMWCFGTQHNKLLSPTCPGKWLLRSRTGSWADPSSSTQTGLTRAPPSEHKWCTSPCRTGGRMTKKNAALIELMFERGIQFGGVRVCLFSYHHQRPLRGWDVAMRALHADLHCKHKGIIITWLLYTVSRNGCKGKQYNIFPLGKYAAIVRQKFKVRNLISHY